MNRLMNHIQIEQSIPIMFKDFSMMMFDYDQHKNKFTVVD